MVNIPTLAELQAQILSDLQAEYGVSIPAFGKSMLRVFAFVQAARLKLYYLLLGFLQKNMLPDLADSVTIGGNLERYGLLKLGRLQFPATQGQYSVEISGTALSVVPAQTTFKSDDTSQSPGFLFILDTAYTLTGSTDIITLRALTAGTDSLLAVGNTLTSTAPILNVNSVGTVTAITVNPTNAETNEEYRDKIIESYRLSPQGGATADYRLWGLDAAGTRQIYPYTVAGSPIQIDVYVEANPDDSTDGKGTPTPTILADVEAAIEADPITGDGRRPMDAIVNVVSIIPLDVDITINAGGTLTADQKTAIKLALNQAVFDVRPFIAGVDIVAERNDTISEFWIGSVVIDAVSGALISSIDLEVDGNPVSSYLFDLGEIPYINDTLINFT